MQNSNGEDQDQTILGYPILKLKSMTSCLCEIFTLHDFLGAKGVHWFFSKFVELSSQLLFNISGCLFNPQSENKSHPKIAWSCCEPTIYPIELIIKNNGSRIRPAKTLGLHGFSPLRSSPGTVRCSDWRKSSPFGAFLPPGDGPRGGASAGTWPKLSRVECYWKSLKITVEQLGGNQLG